MTDFLKIAKSIAVHFAHICAYGVETVNKQMQYLPIVGYSPGYPVNTSECGNFNLDCENDE